ncbi:MAG TPA: 4-(cytidine 5'-diphospho)-2-C-methyl-D-erythritol kinase, partial [bacterium]|nr:4-(cytidine 5'-diphospho)-2-C-methyl-D-erythritol kinase [bacterium]
GVTFTCTEPALAGDDNLAVRAVRGWQRVFGTMPGAAVTLTKRVPWGAGLGGGSSDAAAVLRCCAALTGVTADEPRVLALAAELGSDVPFFLTGGCAWATGRGEILRPLPVHAGLGVVIVKPPYGVATKDAYAGLGGRLTRMALDYPAAATLWAAGAYAQLCANDFTPGVAAAHPEMTAVVAQLAAAGALAAGMSGSGSALFGLFPDPAAAQLAAAAVRVDGSVQVAATLAAPAVSRGE